MLPISEGSIELWRVSSTGTGCGPGFQAPCCCGEFAFPASVAGWNQCFALLGVDTMIQLWRLSPANL